MAENEIKLLKDQLLRLEDKNFDLEAWKNHTIIYLERIFGPNNTRIKMIKELHYDYSSWNLRDIAGTGKTTDPVKMQAAEIIEATIYELVQLGLPHQAKANNKILNLLADELTGKQVKEIETILLSESGDKTEKIKAVLDNLEKDGLSLIISRLLTS